MMLSKPVDGSGASLGAGIAGRVSIDSGMNRASLGDCRRNSMTRQIYKSGLLVDYSDRGDLAAGRREFVGLLADLLGELHRRTPRLAQKAFIDHLADVTLKCKIFHQRIRV